MVPLPTLTTKSEPTGSDPRLPVRPSPAPNSTAHAAAERRGRRSPWHADSDNVLSGSRVRQQGPLTASRSRLTLPLVDEERKSRDGRFDGSALTRQMKRDSSPVHPRRETRPAVRHPDREATASRNAFNRCEHAPGRGGCSPPPRVCASVPRPTRGHSRVTSCQARAALPHSDASERRASRCRDACVGRNAVVCLCFDLAPAFARSERVARSRTPRSSGAPEPGFAADGRWWAAMMASKRLCELGGLAVADRLGDLKDA